MLTHDPIKVKGKVVVYNRGAKARGRWLRRQGGVRMLLANTGRNREDLVADAHLIPTMAGGLR